MVKLLRQHLTRRLLAAYLLLLTFLPFFVIKSVHYHKVGSIVPKTETTVVQADQHCDICLFTLSAFTEATATHFTFVAPFIIVVFILSISPIVYREMEHCSLRAPPVF